MTTRSKFPKFTKSVKVGQSVYNPDELNQVAAYLRKHVKNANRRKECAVFYYRVESVSKSGMTRRINFMIISRGELLRINYDLAAITGYKVDKEDRIVMGGCGYSHADHLIQEVFRVLGLDLYRRATGGFNVSAYAVVAI